MDLQRRESKCSREISTVLRKWENPLKKERRCLDIDYLSVKGGGHLVMLDKPREGQQMYYNWIHGLDYSLPLPFQP